MSRDARITLDWADGTYTFRLSLGQWPELQDKCDAGPYVILRRLYDGSWKFEDITNVIRLGLIGGGLTPSEALKKTRSYVDDRPLLENVATATAVLSAGLVGNEDDPVGESAAANPVEKQAKPSPMES